MDNNRELATLGGGCFWCVEAVFEQLRGVEKVVSGYTGGANPNPTYEQVCSGRTGHAEVIQLTFDPSMISFADILRVFFTVHDPTTLNRQGADVGTQYRSAIFYHTDEQRQVASEVIAEINAAGVWGAAVVTEISPIGEFYSAEAYHQEYFRNNAAQSYCRFVVEPKVVKFRQQFADRLKSATANA